MDKLLESARKYGRVLKHPYEGTHEIRLTLRGLSDLVGAHYSLELDVLRARVANLQRQVDSLTGQRNSLELELGRVRKAARYSPESEAARAVELSLVARVLDKDDTFTTSQVSELSGLGTRRAIQLLQSLRALRVVRLLPQGTSRARTWALIGTLDNALQKIEDRKNGRTK